MTRFPLKPFPWERRHPAGECALECRQDAGAPRFMVPMREWNFVVASHSRSRSAPVPGRRNTRTTSAPGFFQRFTGQPRFCARGRAHSESALGQAAFSLLEIMVAVALLAIIIVGLLAMFYQVQRAFRTGTAQVDVMEGGRAAIGVFMRELQEATATSVPGATNLVIVPSPQRIFTPQVLSSGDARMSFLNDLCFLQRRNDDWTGLAYRFTNAATGVGTLYRYAWSWRHETIPASNDETNLVMSRVVGRLPAIPPLPAERPDSISLVLDGVVHFQVEAYDANGISYRSYSNVDDGLLRFDSVNDVYGFLSTNLPAYVDVELRVLELNALAKFRARSEISRDRATNFLAGAIGQTHVFRQRIPLRPAATGATRF